MRRFLSTGLLGVFLTFSFAPAASYANHAWGNYHWARTDNPFPLNLGDNVGSQWQSVFATARSDWNVSGVLNTKIVPGGTSPKRCRATNGRVEVCNSRYGNNGWLGIAQIWASGSHISQSVVKLNDTYFDTSAYDTPAWRALVMCQEVGHAFGLGHQDENFGNANLNTCMDYTSDPESNQHPNDHDYALLADIYAHLDAFNSYVDSSGESGGGGVEEPEPCRGGPKRCGSNANGAAPTIHELVLNDPNQWGRLIAESKNGAQAVFELDLGDSHRVITHVFWIESRHRHHDEH